MFEKIFKDGKIARLIWIMIFMIINVDYMRKPASRLVTARINLAAPVWTDIYILFWF